MFDSVPSKTRPAAYDLVVVLLATFNGSHYIQQQLDSIAAQSHRHWRLVVADDGSSDHTLEIVKSFSERHPGQVHVIPDGRAASARDNFFRLIRNAGPAAYYAFCDQDDVWDSDKLSRLVGRCQEMEAHHRNEACLVYSDLKVVDAQLESLNPSFMAQIRGRPQNITYRSLLAENAIPGCAMLFNKVIADVFRTRDFNQTSAIMHDWWIALLASTIGHISYIPSPLVSYRQHATNTVGTVDRSGLAFTLSKLFRGDRSNALQTYAQAAAFFDTYGDLLDPAVREDVKAFASLPQRHKVDRVRIILKYRLLKQTLGRRAYQLLRA